jgi:hypothetical protein
MDVINEEEKEILENIRKMRKPKQGNHIQPIRNLKNQSNKNKPFYAPEQAHNQQSCHISE